MVIEYGNQMADLIRGKWQKQLDKLIGKASEIANTSGDMGDILPSQCVDRRLYIEWRTRVVTLLPQVLPAKLPIRRDIDECKKRIRTWADIRNAAAHGRPEEFTREQVGLMLVGLRNFLVEHMG